MNQTLLAHLAQIAQQENEPLEVVQSTWFNGHMNCPANFYKLTISNEKFKCRLVYENRI